MQTLPKSIKNSRCILHIDLDCFYCQVEQVRLGIPFDVPAAVQQWHGLIAVNYAARKAGVKKISNITEARRLCPGIQLLHVATYTDNDTEPHYHKNPNRNTHKVSLDAYRNASKKIFKIFNSYCDKIQKIGLDEAFMDVTTVVNQRLKERYLDKQPELLERLDDDICDVQVDWEKLGCVMESLEEKERRSLPDQEYPWNPTTWGDLQLAIGAELAAEIREKVYEELHYFCSAGIAHYKVVAKLCSSKHKPNKQTVLRESARIDFMREVPFNKIRNMGGKLGNEVGSDLDIQFCSELWSYSVEELQRKFGDSNGIYIYNICRGIDSEEVNPTKAPKSLGANKTFTMPITRKEDMSRWFTILAVELQSRIMQNFEEFSTWPRSIAIRYATTHKRTYRSKLLGSFSRDELKTYEILSKRFEKAYNALEDGYPCVGIDLVASGLTLDESAKSHTLSRFFHKSTSSAHDSNGQVKDEIKIETKADTKLNMREAPQKDSATPRKPNRFFNTSSTIVSSSKSNASTSSSNGALIEDTYMCDRCRKRISILEIEEHSDYHFALDLQNQAGIHTPPRKRKNNEKEERHKKISSFFQPKSI